MVECRRRVGDGPNTVEMVGAKCDRCGFTRLDNDDDVWAAVGL